MKIIGITGVKGSGKDTAHEILKRHYPDIKSVALAGKLKQVCVEALGLTEEQITDRDLKEAILEIPIYLTASKITRIYDLFEEGENITYDQHIRPHVGMCLESPRRALQYVGTEILRSVRDNIHSYYLYNSLKDAEGTYFVTDLRFFDEYEFFVDKFDGDFEVWYIHNVRAELAGVGDTHPSEQGVSKIKPKALIVDNNGTLDDFERTLLGVFK